MITIGTRGSPLALAQAREVQARLAAGAAAMDLDFQFEIVVIRTTGDKIRDRPLADIGGKGLFTKEIEDALIEGAIDLAVHSMKDMLTILPEGLGIAAMLEREDARDALIARDATSILELPQGAVIGTASLRRQAQVLAQRPDLRPALLRGNVETRLAKVAGGEVDATLLALAGLKRLGKASAASAILSTQTILPAAGQGAIGIEARLNEDRLAGLLAAISHLPTEWAVRSERVCLRELEGSCKTPIAAYAELEGETIWLRALVAAPDGSALFRAEDRAPAADGERLGLDIGRRLIAAAGAKFRV